MVYRERTLSGEGLNKINEYVYIDIPPCLMNNEPVILAKEEDVWASVHEKDANEKLRILDQFKKDEVELNNLIHNSAIQRDQNIDIMINFINEINCHDEKIVSDTSLISNCKLADDDSRSNIDCTHLLPANVIEKSKQDQSDWLRITEVEFDELIEKSNTARLKKCEENLNIIRNVITEADILNRTKIEKDDEYMAELYKNISRDHFLLNELVLSINKELNTNYHNIQTEILLLENPMHNLSILALKLKHRQNLERMAELYNELLMDRDFQRKQLFCDMKSMIEKDEIAQRHVAAEALRRHAESVFPPRCSNLYQSNAFGSFLDDAESVSRKSYIHENENAHRFSHTKSRKDILKPLEMKGIIFVRPVDECVVCADIVCTMWPYERV
ncbi:unnamed protein product [Dracunculus medinensis]|uniref:HAP1 N-terminal domain-containing protein n=1 Tax=Dracunculus medinensis TaxID=318479 RepID=A0A0N4URN7_DRAME|nr:unnamed protein product [Dracunculus medinensis]